MTDNLNVYSPEHLLLQAQSAEEKLGYKIVHFFVDSNGTLARTPTPVLGTFYYSPSGGTLRDENMNIVLYSAKFDVFKGFGRL